MKFAKNFEHSFFDANGDWRRRIMVKKYWGGGQSKLRNLYTVCSTEKFMQTELLEDSKPIVSGHETFSLRFGWLKKSYDLAKEMAKNGAMENAFRAPSAIATLGAGRNMCLSMEFWGKSTQIIAQNSDIPLIPSPTELGDRIFGEGGLDPYMEKAQTSALVHYLLASNRSYVSWFYLFNEIPHESFVADDLLHGVVSKFQVSGTKMPSRATIQRDIQTCINCYAKKLAKRKAAAEDIIDGPLVELGFLKREGDEFFLQPLSVDLSPSMFAYLIFRYWRQSNVEAGTLAVDALRYSSGSPGKVLRIASEQFEELVDTLAETTNGVFIPSDGGGVRQIQRSEPLSFQVANRWLDGAYV